MASKKDLIKRIEQLESELQASVESERQAQRRIDALKKERDEHLQFVEENKSLRTEQVVAEQIQKSMLPTAYPAFPEHPQIDLFADMEAAREIGGDFYNYFVIDETRVCFMIADVEGKGIPAALHMATIKTMLELRILAGETPEAMFEEINATLCKGKKQRRFVTVWLGLLDVASGRLSCINAGHNFPVIKRKNEPPELLSKRSGLPLASYYSEKRPERNKYQAFEEKLSPGDVLFLYTDGVVEAINKEKSIFGEQRLLCAIDTYMADDHTAKELTSYVHRQVIKFANHTEQDDDITLLAVRFLQRPNPTP